MSAMSASPVKPILSQGVPGGSVSNVVTPPPTASPTAKSMMTNSPVKQASLNHAVPLSLISEHKVQSLPPPAVQPLPRTPEKPREPPPRPTSNGVEPTVAGSSLMPQEHPHSLLLPPLKPDDGFPAAVSNNAPSCPAVATVADKQPSDSLGSPSFNTGGSATDLTATSFRPSEQQGPISSKPELEVKVPPVQLRQPLSIPITTPAPICTPLPLPSAPAIPPSSQTSALPPLTDLPLPIPAPTPTFTPIPTAEQHATPVPPTTTPAVVEQPMKARNEVTAPMIKVATIPRGAKRKREPKGSVSAMLTTPVSKKEVAITNATDDRKSKRLRLPTQPYQSPLPELTLIAKINKMTPTKAPDDKLIVFYRNEFLAVRNAEGSFYICQAMQNIYKSSPRIRIRWLSLEAGDLYSPDFYDTTDFDCILTNLNMERVEKEKFRLPSDELHRTESILKRALDVEKGVQEKPSVTEEHPDGLDLSLFRDESQLKKPGKTVNKPPKTENQIIPSKDTFEFEESSSSGEEKKRKKKAESADKISGKKKKPIKKKPPPIVVPKKIIVPPVKPVVVVPVSNKSKEPATTVAKKMVVSTPTTPVDTPPRSAVKRKLLAITPVIEKRAKKVVLETATPVPDRTSKTRSVGSAGHKSTAVVPPAPLAEKIVQSFVIKTKPLVRKVMERARRGVPVTTTTASTSKTRKK